MSTYSMHPSVLIQLSTPPIHLLLMRLSCMRTPEISLLSSSRRSSTTAFRFRSLMERPAPNGMRANSASREAFSLHSTMSWLSMALVRARSSWGQHKRTHSRWQHT